MTANGKWYDPLLDFLTHILGGTFLFLIIAGAAVGLDFLIKYLGGIQASSFIIAGLKGAEYALFGIDLALFAQFLVLKWWEFAWDMRKEFKASRDKKP